MGHFTDTPVETHLQDAEVPQDDFDPEPEDGPEDE